MGRIMSCARVSIISSVLTVGSDAGEQSDLCDTSSLAATNISECCYIHVIHTYKLTHQQYKTSSVYCPGILHCDP